MSMVDLSLVTSFSSLPPHLSDLLRWTLGLVIIGTVIHLYIYFSLKNRIRAEAVVTDLVTKDDGWFSYKGKNGLRLSLWFFSSSTKNDHLMLYPELKIMTGPYQGHKAIDYSIGSYPSWFSKGQPVEVLFIPPSGDIKTERLFVFIKTVRTSIFVVALGLLGYVIWQIMGV